ncbi:MAG: hypothetical protein L3J08_04330 [Flavobacteriaceae bacterium]|nr:hypothetical protein [Flavobacteriaceae bacterium]
MKKTIQFLIVGVIIFGIYSCNKQEEINEPAGLAEYRINNQTSKILIFKSNPEIIMPVGETKKIGSDGGIGIIAPLPSVGLGLLKLYRDDNGNEILALERDPIIDNEWTVEKQDDQEYGLVYYTITISDSMIN